MGISFALFCIRENIGKDFFDYIANSNNEEVKTSFGEDIRRNEAKRKYAFRDKKSMKVAIVGRGGHLNFVKKYKNGIWCVSPDLPNGKSGKKQQAQKFWK